MDRRLTVICIVCLTEIVFRYFAVYAPVGNITYTLAVRIVQTALILVFSLQYCGVLTDGFIREIIVGLCAAAIFATLVLISDITSRLFIQGGVLNMLIARQDVDQPFLFLLTGCLVGPFTEELFFRGLLYAWMRQRASAAICVLLTSFLFASLHGSISLVQLSGGILFACLYEWRKSIWAPFVVHSLANIGIWLVPYLNSM